MTTEDQEEPWERCQQHGMIIGSCIACYLESGCACESCGGLAVIVAVVVQIVR